MNTAIDLLRQAEAAGVHLELEADGALYARGPIDEDLITRLRQHRAELMHALVAGRYGLSVAELHEAAGSDWPTIEINPPLMVTLARAVQVRRMRELGHVPAHYTSTTICAGCGSVPIFSGAPSRVMSCPWCLNRIAGRPVPNGGGHGGDILRPSAAQVPER